MENIQRLGHDSFIIKSKDKIIYIDPFKLQDGKQADLILITHTHYDHYDNASISKILKDSTTIIGPEDIDYSDAIKMHPGESKEIQGIKIEAVRAYNIEKKNHPKEKNWLGYIITINSQRIYHAGDTDLIPEMKRINCNIALLPVSGGPVMTAEEAFEAVKILKPKIAIPMHYGSIIGSDADAEKFKELCKNITEVKII